MKLTLSSWVLLKLPLFKETPYLYFEIVQSIFCILVYAFEISLLTPILLLIGAFIASDFLICYSDRSTFSPLILKKEANDFFYLLGTISLSVICFSDLDKFYSEENGSYKGFLP